MGDRERLREVASNLVMNAIKFSGAGAHVTVSTWRDGDGCGFTVSDDGPGVSPEAREVIFERFGRAEESRTRERGGSRLGLAICHEIVEAHGGRLELDDRAGSGASFRVALRGAASGS